MDDHDDHDNHDDYLTCSGVCEFDFNELCKKPTGASDYISLCKSLTTIFFSFLNM